MCTLQNFYGKTPFYDDVIVHIRKIYDIEHKWLIDMNMELINFFLDYFKIKIELLFSSQIQVEGFGTARLVNLTQRIEADRYLTGIGSRDYLDESLFVREGIEVVWQKYDCPVYPQLYGRFVSGLSCLDFAMNCGNNFKELLGKNAQKNDYSSSGSNGVFSVAK